LSTTANIEGATTFKCILPFSPSSKYYKKGQWQLQKVITGRDKAVYHSR